MPFLFSETSLQDCFIIESQVFDDSRGYFLEGYVKKDFEKRGIFSDFVQTNISKNQKWTLRWLHFQKNFPQAKLVSVLSGKIYDVVVDLRIHSKTFGKHCAVELSAQNAKMLFVPRGFAHGFLALEKDTIVLYHTDEYYQKDDESGIIYNDEALQIDWETPKKQYKIDTIILSKKDTMLSWFCSEKIFFDF